MCLIKLNATDSTNDYLKELCQTGEAKNGTVVWAEYQEKGRGQKNRNWESQEGKNLTISRLQSLESFPASDQFTISCAVSLACLATLKKKGIPNLSIKWPNDIMAGGRKIGGILIENIVKGKEISRAIVGIGLNVNQESFNSLPNAVSLYQILGKPIDREELLTSLVGELDRYFKELIQSQESLRANYMDELYLKGENWQFKTEDNNVISGRITGVTHDGRLRLQTADGYREFAMSEISYLDY